MASSTDCTTRTFAVGAPYSTRQSASTDGSTSLP